MRVRTVPSSMKVLPKKHQKNRQWGQPCVKGKNGKIGTCLTRGQMWAKFSFYWKNRKCGGFADFCNQFCCAGTYGLPGNFGLCANLVETPFVLVAGFARIQGYLLPMDLNSRESSYEVPLILRRAQFWLRRKPWLSSRF